MTEKTVFSSLFPAGIIESSNNIICLKNKLDNSIQSLLLKNGFNKMYNEINVFFNRELILIYNKKESKSKKTRNEIFKKCIELKNNYNDHTIMIGYLIGTDTINEAEVIFQNIIFKIMVGETLLKFILPYDAILNEYRNEVNDFFN